ncbi:hypothetical protein RGQ15_00610 [Paracoccus sp. MBLB3053]|uniref:DUF1127 domain-containing protein n=1 Tax=Paracoccus aurantius TaxID=3073814 RepID=A0ABU2HM29_9RHOB|nr:hypothetical protein [Paracoccus sp. MBLB3053]MDS9466078.1 hypothetical protein [Paracoccus sp. MBLB3053]
MFDCASQRQPKGLVDRILSFLGLGTKNKQRLYVATMDRAAALDDPATRKILSELPPHLLRDVGVSMPAPPRAESRPIDGEALRKHLW